MIFKKLNLEFYTFTEENLDDIRQLLKKGIKKAKFGYYSNVGNGKPYSDVTSDDASVLNPDVFSEYRPGYNSKG